MAALGVVAGMEPGDEVPEGRVHVVLRGLHGQVGERGLLPFAVNPRAAFERKASNLLLQGDEGVQFVVAGALGARAVSVAKVLASGEIEGVPQALLGVAPQHKACARLHRGVLAERLGVVEVEVSPPAAHIAVTQVVHIVLRHHGVYPLAVALLTLVVVIAVDAE